MELHEVAWDDLVASSPLRGSTTTSTVRLPLFREPLRAWLRRKARSVDQIEPALRQVIGQAVRGESRWPLVLTGPAGTGKTCAALCLLDHAGGLYFTAALLAEAAIQAAKGQLTVDHCASAISERMLWREIASTALVVLDELGAREKVSDWHYEQVKRLLDDREGKPLVVISNLSFKALAGLYDDRIASRLAGGTVLSVMGVDRRLGGGG